MSKLGNSMRPVRAAVASDTPWMPPRQAHGPARLLEAGMALLLAVTFATGGSSQDHGPGDTLAQLVALPVLVTAALALAALPAARLRRVAIGVAVLIAVFPALQLLPLPMSWWLAIPGRAALLADLRVAGVSPTLTWTLSPAATERALWSQLPAVAVFLGSLAISDHSRRRLLVLVLGLITAGLLLGLMQMLVSQESVLNPHPQWVPVVGGVFANPNHQASALVIGALLGTALWLHMRREPRARWRAWAGAACALLCLVTLPATDSRAGMLLAGPALAALLIAAGSAGRTPMGRRVTRLPALLGGGVVLLCGGWALRVFQQTMGSEARWPMATATAELAADAWPLGTGMGSFPRWFEQSGSDALLGLEFINHAHNEYVQWWLEGGLPAMALLAAALVTLGLAVRALFKRRAGPLSHGAWVGVVVLLASSVVDYPLRTAALMTIGAYLAGAVVARATRPARRQARG